MRIELRHFFSAAIGFAPLFIFALWAYSPAKPYAYPDVPTLLSTPYTSAAAPLPAAELKIRQVVLLAVALGSTFALLQFSRGGKGSLLCGVLGSLLLVQPSAVPWILSAEPVNQLLRAVGLFAGGVMAAVLFARHFPAVIVPLAAWSLFVGVILGVSSAETVVTRSNPPLFVLSEYVRKPDSAEAQLAVGMHFLAIGGREEALPYLRFAGKELSKRYTPEQAPELSAITVRLAALSLNESDVVFDARASDERLDTP